MKKILLTILVIIILLLASGYAEVSYCHYWTTTPPSGSPVDYIKTTGFCRINAYPSMPGAIFLGFARLAPRAQKINQFTDLTQSQPSKSSARWTTYTDNKLGISFQYPLDWYVTEYNDSAIGDIELSIQSPTRHEYFEKHPDGPGGAIAEISVTRNQLGFYNDRTDLIPVTFNGVAAKKRIYNGDGPTFESYIIQRQSYIYEIRSETNKGDIESRILASIKFIR